MGSRRAAGYLLRVRESLRAAFVEDHPPHLLAASFAIGVFVTTLPSFGAGLLLLTWIGYRFAWANVPTMFAAVAVLNPLVKGGVYVVSFVIGARLLGPVPGITRGDIGMDAGFDVLVRLLVGNVLLAVVLAMVGYAVAYRAGQAARRYGH
ncbi:DUF2062 domain-containing protein [Halalkalicoccus tibetensis]|uniref:DUF2062 domain-containing protein n=1 Tax=Halalkalicoccus tibetensis TaxID=175632 RepID=A0ABD5V2T7_9EURY